MSEPAIFAFRRNGETKVYGDRWGGALIHRELLWGPEALEAWASHMHELALDDLEEPEPGVLVDFDNRRMSWSGASFDDYKVPVVRRLYERLLAAAWPDYEIDYQEEGLWILSSPQETPARERDSFEYRSPFNEASRSDYEPDPDDPEEDDEPAFDEEETWAWVTLVSKKGNIRQRYFEQLPCEFFRPSGDFAKRVAELPSVNIPPEKSVFEGAVIDIPKRTLSLWGDGELKHTQEQLLRGWKGWKVSWLDGDYQQHCDLIGIDAIATSEAELLAKFLPAAMSNKRFSMGNIMGAIGGGLKKKAVSAAGCLFVLVCLPILIFAIFSGKWMAAGISVLVTLVIFVVVFKLFEYKIKKNFRPVTEMAAQRDSQIEGPEVAGPQDKEERAMQLDKLLAKAGLPSIEEAKQFFGDATELDYL